MYFRRTIAALLLTAVIAPTATKAAEESRREPVLTVLGKGEFETKPDIARFTVSIVTDHRTIDGAGKSHEDRATRGFNLLKALAEEGIEIEKSTFKLDERRAQRPIPPTGASGQRTETLTEGFRASTAFSVKTANFEKLNSVIGKLAESGLFEIQAIRFYVSNERAALNQARRAAMLDAKEQAQAYVEPADLRLEQIIAITDGEAVPVEGYADMPARRAPGPDLVQVVPPATLNFSARVNVTWRIAYQ